MLCEMQDACRANAMDMPELEIWVIHLELEIVTDWKE